jgi:hypothetical protein
MGFKSGFMAGQGSQQDIRRLTGGMRCRVEAVMQASGGCTRYWTLNNTCRQVINKWRFESESIYTCLVASGWLSKWGTTTGCKTSLMHWSPVRLPCMVTKSSLQSWDTPPNHYWAFTVRDSWRDVPWGIGCIVVSPNPHPAVGYMKQKPALVWPMDLARAVTAYLQCEAVTYVPWPAMSPDLNPMEHIWDMFGHRIHARKPLVQNIHPSCFFLKWQMIRQVLRDYWPDILKNAMVTC